MLDPNICFMQRETSGPDGVPPAKEGIAEIILQPNFNGIENHRTDTFKNKIRKVQE